MTDILRAFEATVSDVNRKERSIVATINTGHTDRFNSRIVPEGARLENYSRGAKPVLWEHGKDPRRHNDPIGNNLWIKPVKGSDGTELRAKTKFLEDDFAQQRYEWYRDGVLSGFSIRPLPDWTRCSMATKDEIRADPELGRGVYSEGGAAQPGVMMFREWDLGEYSAVTLVGNAHCQTTERAAQLLSCVEAGLWLPDEDLAVLRGLSAVPESVATGLDNPPPEQGRADPHISHQDGWWRVHIDGQIVAGYQAEAVAVRCLANLMGSPGPRYTERVQTDVMAIRAWSDQQVARAVEELDLRLNGRLGSGSK